MPGLLQLGAHLAILAATGVLVWLSRGSWWLLPAIVLYGLVLDFLFCALHESVHRTAFASRWLNDAVGFVSGALLLQPLEYFRLFHSAHHRFAQDPAKDPELASPKPTSLQEYLWLASGLPNWRRRIGATLHHALTGRVAEPFVPPAKHRQIVREARILWGLYLSIALVSLALRRDDALIYWVLPAIAGQPFLRLYLLPEHTGCAMSGDAFADTRTTYTNRAVRLLAWQMPYHAEHHAYPSVPFHALGRLNALTRTRIQVSGRGYLAVQRQLLRDLRAMPAAARRT